MKKVINKIISQIIVIMISVQMIGQYGASLIPQINAVGDENKAEISEIQDEAYENETDAGTFEAEEELESDVNDIADIDVESKEPTESEYEDWNVTSNTTLNDLTEVQNLYISGGTLDLNGNTLIVHGDVVITSSGKLNFNEGELICNNFTMSGENLYMGSPNDHLIVNGNFNFKGGEFSGEDGSAGTIEVSGDVDITSGFIPSGNQKFVLNGLDSQNVYINGQKCKFNILEVANTSDEGVVSSIPINANSITGSLNQLHYTFGGSIGTVLQENSEIDGDYHLSVGDLDLNGKTLTINGDFIQSGGNVILNGGHLIINGDYLIQTKNEDGTFTYSTGTLNMTNKSDKVDVAGNFVMGSTKSHKDSLTNGTLTVGGDFSQLDVGSNSASNFSASGNHTTKIKGKTKQSIKFDNPTQSSFLNISFENAAGISLDTNVYAYGKVKDEYKSVNGSYLYH